MFELDKSVNLNKLVEFDNCLWTISWNFDEVWRVGKVRQADGKNDPDVQASRVVDVCQVRQAFMFKLDYMTKLDNLLQFGKFVRMFQLDGGL
jgi:hypothetical protein